MNRTAPVIPRPLEHHFIRAVGVGHVDLAARGVDGHVKQGRAHRAEDGALRQGVCVDGEDVVIGKVKGDRGVAIGAVGIEPVATRQLDDRAHFGSGVPVGIVVRARRAADAEAVVDRDLVDHSGLVARHEGGDVDGGSVGRERARGIGEEGQDVDGRSADGGSETRRVEDPNVCAVDARGCKTRIGGIATSEDTRNRRMGSVLSTMCRGDEGAIPAGPCEYDVAGLIADQQRTGHHRHGH